MKTPEANKALIAPLRAAMYDFEFAEVKKVLNDLSSPDAIFHHCEPFGDFTGANAFFDSAYKPLKTAFPDLERRDYIVTAGDTPSGDQWVGCAGFYSGTFKKTWLDIPPTGHIATMRFHEFYRIVDDKIVEFQAIWDIPELMMQANAWPMVPSLGHEFLVPAPATMDGVSSLARDADKSAASCNIVVQMLEDLQKHPQQGGPEVMKLDQYWHPRMNWYGPAGIGTARGIEGFRNWHQIPFLNAMPDRGQYREEISCHFFAENNYVAVTGWPDMVQTLSGAGWLGLPAMDKKISMRSLDFWRIEGDLIRENWVLVDLLHVYSQLGIDVFERLREFNKARLGLTSQSNLEAV